MGDLSPTISQIRSLLDDGYRVVVAADGEASANRLGALMAEHEVVLDISIRTGWGRRSARRRVVVAPIERGVVLSDIKLGDRRIRCHRPPPHAPSGPAPRT